MFILQHCGSFVVFTSVFYYATHTVCWVFFFTRIIYKKKKSTGLRFLNVDKI